MENPPATTIHTSISTTTAKEEKEGKTAISGEETANHGQESEPYTKCQTNIPPPESKDNQAATAAAVGGARNEEQQKPPQNLYRTYQNGVASTSPESVMTGTMSTETLDSVFLPSTGGGSSNITTITTTSADAISKKPSTSPVQPEKMTVSSTMLAQQSFPHEDYIFSNQNSGGSHQQIVGPPKTAPVSNEQQQQAPPAGVTNNTANRPPRPPTQRQSQTIHPGVAAGTQNECSGLSVSPDLPPQQQQQQVQTQTTTTTTQPINLQPLQQQQQVPPNTVPLSQQNVPQAAGPIPVVSAGPTVVGMVGTTPILRMASGATTVIKKKKGRFNVLQEVPISSIPNDATTATANLLVATPVTVTTTTPVALGTYNTTTSPPPQAIPNSSSSEPPSLPRQNTQLPLENQQNNSAPPPPQNTQNVSNAPDQPTQANGANATQTMQPLPQGSYPQEQSQTPSQVQNQVQMGLPTTSSAPEQVPAAPSRTVRKKGRFVITSVTDPSVLARSAQTQMVPIALTATPTMIATINPTAGQNQDGGTGATSVTYTPAALVPQQVVYTPAPIPSQPQPVPNPQNTLLPTSASPSSAPQDGQVKTTESKNQTQQNQTTFSAEQEKQQQPSRTQQASGSYQTARIKNNLASQQGLGKVFYFLDQMRAEVMDADRTIKALQAEIKSLQTDMKFLKEKNKELEAKGSEAEKKLNEERILRQTAEEKLKALRRRIREMKEEGVITIVNGGDERRLRSDSVNPNSETLGETLSSHTMVAPSPSLSLQAEGVDHITAREGQQRRPSDASATRPPLSESQKEKPPDAEKSTSPGTTGTTLVDPRATVSNQGPSDTTTSRQDPGTVAASTASLDNARISGREQSKLNQEQRLSGPEPMKKNTNFFDGEPNHEQQPSASEQLKKKGNQEQVPKSIVDSDVNAVKVPPAVGGLSAASSREAGGNRGTFANGIPRSQSLTVPESMQANFPQSAKASTTSLGSKSLQNYSKPQATGFQQVAQKTSPSDFDPLRSQPSSNASSPPFSSATYSNGNGELFHQTQVPFLMMEQQAMAYPIVGVANVEGMGFPTQNSFVQFPTQQTLLHGNVEAGQPQQSQAVGTYQDFAPGMFFVQQTDLELPQTQMMTFQPPDMQQGQMMFQQPIFQWQGSNLPQQQNFVPDYFPQQRQGPNGQQQTWPQQGVLTQQGWQQVLQPGQIWPAQQQHQAQQPKLARQGKSVPSDFDPLKQTPSGENASSGISSGHLNNTIPSQPIHPSPASSAADPFEEILLRPNGQG